MNIATAAKAAKPLAHNPLGIIALFLALVDGIAAVALGVTTGSLSAALQAVLVWFIVLFPAVVLIVFYLLVTRHHTKLYAPKDYESPDGFFRALTPEEQRVRMERELAREAVDAASSTPVQEPERTAGKSTRTWRQSLMLAEELAIRELEHETGINVVRQVAVAGSIEVDGAYLEYGKLTLVEVKLVNDRSTSETVRSAFARFDRIAQGVKPVAFVLILLALDEDSKGVQELVLLSRNLAKDAKYPVDVRVYDHFELQQKYGALD